MEKITVSEADVINTLQEIVDEQPDYVYARPAHMEGNAVTCLYVHTGEEADEVRTPGCLVGQVLSRLGVPLEELEKHEGSSALSVVPRFVDTTNRAVGVLSDAQDYQDGGDSWSESLYSALRGNPVPDDYAA